MYTTIPKPTGSNYTNVKNGSPLFDDSTIAYDDSSFFYDGDSPLSYTNIGKPINDSKTWDTITTTWNIETRTWDEMASYINMAKPQ